MRIIVVVCRSHENIKFYYIVVLNNTMFIIFYVTHFHTTTLSCTCVAVTTKFLHLGSKKAFLNLLKSCFCNFLHAFGSKDRSAQVSFSYK